MSTMRAPLQTVFATKQQHKGPFKIKTLVNGQLRYYVRAYVTGRPRTVAICDSEVEAQRAYLDYQITRAWQAFPPLSPAQQERLTYYARTVPTVCTILEQLLKTFVQPIPVVPDRRGQQVSNLKKRGAR